MTEPGLGRSAKVKSAAHELLDFMAINWWYIL
jgi:hypothetical protein